MKVLVIEDSIRLRRALTEGFRRSGLVFDTAGDGEEGARYARTFDYDVIVLDLMLPGLDGLSLLKQLRDAGDHTQVLVLSARDAVEDRVRGLELGADDYLVKPFAFDELLARIKTLARRRHQVNQSKIKIGQVTIDTSKRQAHCGAREVPLTPAEYNLLEHLALRRGRVVPKSRLRQWLTDAGSEAVSNVVEVLVSNIRKKIGALDENGIIRTKRGFGYYVE